MLDWRVNQTGSHVAIIGLGNAYPLAEQTAAALSADYGITATVIDPRQCTSLDSDVPVAEHLSGPYSGRRKLVARM